jgi:hypothetical protein
MRLENYHPVSIFQYVALFDYYRWKNSWRFSLNQIPLSRHSPPMYNPILLTKSWRTGLQP